MNKEKLFTIIWQKHAKSILYYIRHVLPIEVDSYDDLFQEIMLKIYQSLDRYTTKFSLQSWIYTISRNHCVDYLKKKKTSVEFDERITQDLRYDGLTQCETLELSEKISIAIEKLEPTSKEIVYLHFFENMKYRDIGAILDINVNTVKTKIKRSKEILHSHLKEYV